MEELYPSVLVKSVAGRDKGGLFGGLSILDEQYVFISDGKKRRVEQPKKKKKKHLRCLGCNSEWLAGKLAGGGRVTNAEVRNALADFLSEQIGGHENGRPEPNS